jgi:hypothetical protein
MSNLLLPPAEPFDTCTQPGHKLEDMDQQIYALSHGEWHSASTRQQQEILHHVCTTHLLHSAFQLTL